ncbi:flavin reductase family protein [Flagellimonas allohymeniacidonis]|uniref:Flavin oxidoreductase n=1 Tax=Flagellimonas allohymeniacidonis TaxID=2517819 RepID=A0A4Q8Q947_9FLAO|nr:flavin reductase [Allomuricauda hymeniacidonis]TAI46775.1 flavin oxidoreductase [Allomuricauda hymeniacidonis]
MNYFSQHSLEHLPSRQRANLINTITGYKSANLIATRTPQGTTNLAIFNSVIHLGSNPALLGFVLRPLTIRRHTYDNLKATSCFTVNAITQEMYREAHHTSAKYPENESEFSMTSFTESYKDGFEAPYVQQSPIQIGCRYVNEYEIKENGCILMVGAVEHIYVVPGLLHEDHWAQLDRAKIMSVVGIDGYALPELEDRLAYARPNLTQKSILDGPQEG